MKLRVTQDFTDLKEDTFRNLGQEFTVTKERGQEIIDKGYAVEVVEEKEEKPAAKRATKELKDTYETK